MTAIVEVRGVSKHVPDAQAPEGRRPLLKNLDFSIAAGEYVTITGRSGAGKSTLLGIIAALDDDFTGEVRVSGVALNHLRARARAVLRNQGLGIVFQAPHLFRGLTVWQNLTAPGWISGRPIDAGRARRLLERVGLGAAAARDAAVLSGGEKQRLSVARALLNAPPLLLCDEPTGNLDAQTGGELLDLIDELRRETPFAVIAVTHDAALVARAHRTLRIAAGALDPSASP